MFQITVGVCISASVYQKRSGWGQNIYPYYMCWSPKQYKDTFRNSTQYQNQRIILKMTKWKWACLELKS